MRWDWYQATIPDRPERIIDAVVAPLPFPEVKEGRPRNGYAKQAEILNGGSPVAFVSFGGSNGLPNAGASGDNAPGFAEIIRREFPRHRVTRCDACEDFHEAGGFDRLVPVFLGVADECAIKVKHEGDWHRAEDGRTLYGGAVASSFRARLYEKGKQMRGLYGVDMPDWFRLEAQLRPHGSQREQAATISPVAAWGFSRWSPKMLKAIMSVDVRRAAPSTYREPEWQRSYNHFIIQYSSILLRVREMCGGSWEEVGSDIGQRVERLLEERSFSRKH